MEIFCKVVKNENDTLGNFRGSFSIKKQKNSRVFFEKFPRFLAGMQKGTKKKKEDFDFINVSAICRQYWVGKGNFRWRDLLRFKFISNILDTPWQNECPPFRVQNQNPKSLNGHYFSASDSEKILKFLEDKKKILCGKCAPIEFSYGQLLHSVGITNLEEFERKKSKKIKRKQYKEKNKTEIKKRKKYYYEKKKN